MPPRQTGSHADRYRQIADALGRHGLGYLTGTLGLDRFIPFHRGLLGHAPRPEPYTRPEHVRLAIEDLGATFIKLGQILSSRPDLMSPDYLVELAKLQDHAPPVPTDQVREVLTAELGRPPEEVFARFEAVPLAAASIGQVHGATLADGTEVVVKVRRPGVVELIDEDLEILQNLAATASRRWAGARNYDLVGLAQEFASGLRAELDYIREGRNAERFAASFAGDPTVHIPRVYWETTTSRVLTLERIRGFKITDRAELDAAGIDRPELARRAARIILKMIFDDGFFHADPHAGNFFIEPGNRIALIDFGLVGTVEEQTREQLARVLLALNSRESERLVDTLLDFGVARGRVDRGALRRDLDHLLSRVYTQSIGEIALGPVLGETLAIVRRHHLQLPATLALLLKTAIMEEGLGAQLDPDFRLTEVLAPYAQRLVMRQYSPFVWARRLGQSGLEAAQLGVELPLQLRRLLGDLERGGLEVSARLTDFEPLVHRLEHLANRLVLGVLAAAFVNGLAILLSAYHPPGWEQWAGPMAAVGFALAAGLGLVLAWSIVRTWRD